MVYQLLIKLPTNHEILIIYTIKHVVNGFLNVFGGGPGAAVK